MEGREIEDLAGIRNAKGAVDRDLPTEDLWIPPRIDLFGDRLTWSPYLRGHQGRVVRPGPKMLERFRTLHRAKSPPTAILKFARQWGVMKLCGCGFPETHDYNQDCDGSQPSPDRQGAYYELVSQWAALSRKADSLIRIAAAIDQDKHILRHQDYEVICDPNLYEGAAVHSYSKEEVAAVVGFPNQVKLRRVWMAANNWVWSARVRPQLELFEEIPTPRLYGGGLYGLLGLRVFMAIANVDDQVFCDPCGELIPITGRKPARGKLYNCGCDPRFGWRDNQRRLRERKATALQLAKQGLDPETISERVGSKPKTISGWLKKAAGPHGKERRIGTGKGFRRNS